ncbi:hypothetical protein NSA47_04935 [Irregularibacter muris]|uniref:Uncharacterized protein n=1 Tax=Irregularibacter muris TaxID=1796619 RepID=A0AAE3HFT8_9FIRM|nr:hypothetical protein [Irregularibacter muris]MCR1898333.1 hypothetical protein [Irregularibacter muris]
MFTSIERVLKYIFSLFILISLLGGGIVFILFVVAIIAGGERGSTMAIYAASGIMPLFIKIAALAIIVGLFYLYLTKSHSLSLQDEKNR